MKDHEHQSPWQEALWRGKPAEAETAELRAWLAAHPEAQADWELESALNAGLSRLPDAPVPSNFTARVLQAIEREEVRPPALVWRWHWRRLLPRVAGAMAVAMLAGLAIYHHEIYRQRVAFAQNVALVTTAQPLPSAEALENFDAIRRMSQPQHADDELLALLQ